MPKCMTEEEARSWLHENRPYIELIEGSWGGRTAVHSMFRCLREGCGHVWSAKFNNIKSGYGCPKCAGHIKVTEEEAREWLRQNAPTIVIAEDGWGGAASKPSTFRCLVDGCGYEWTTSFSNVKQKPACYRCSGKMIISEQDAAHWLSEHKPEIVIDDGGWGGSASVKSRFRCLVDGCGEIWDQTFANIKHGYGCPACGIRRTGEKRRITEQDASRWLLKNRPNIAIAQNGWGGASTARSMFCCLEDGCDHRWETTFVRIKSGAVCPKCEQKRRHLYRMIPESEVSDWLSTNRPDVALVPGSWRGSRYKAKFRCLHDGCGYEWLTQFTSIKGGMLCPRCTGKITWTEEDVVKWLSDNMPDVTLADGGWGGSVSARSRFRCVKDDCGYEWDARFVEIRKILGCPKCLGHIKYTEDMAREWLAENRKDLVMLDGGWGGSSHGRSRFMCTDPLCGHCWSTSFHSIKGGTGCPKCGHRQTSHKRTIKESYAVEWLRKNRPDIALAEGGWGGSGKKKSRFRCLKKGCGVEWCTAFMNIKNGTGCPGCAKRASRLYNVDGLLLDSSWETITYLYHRKIAHTDITRIRCHDKNYGLGYEMNGKQHVWYPDFLIDGVLYEVKPDCGGRFSSERRKTEAKKIANSKYNYGVVFVGDRKIRHWSRCLREHGYSYDEYLIGTKYDYPKAQP